MTITEKGQVTIPQHVREALGLYAAMEVEFTIEGDHAVIRKKEAIEAAVKRLEQYKGTANIGMSTDQILALTRK